MRLVRICRPCPPPRALVSRPCALLSVCPLQSLAAARFMEQHWDATQHLDVGVHWDAPPIILQVSVALGVH